ncbi:MAG: DUF5060 domain-containing protein [Candidatus Buchananbacteria bacterium]
MASFSQKIKKAVSRTGTATLTILGSAVFLLVIFILIFLGYGLVKKTNVAQALTDEGLVISQSQNSNSIGQYEKFELTFILEGNYSDPSNIATYKNPFDADQIKVDIIFTQPDGTNKTVLAFYYMEYDIVSGNPERYGNGRDPSWKARFAPIQLGTYSYVISVTNNNGTITTPGASTFQCVQSSKKGFIRVDPYDQYLLRRTTGEQFFPIGYNQTCAGNNTGIAWWRAHFQKMHENGVTWERIWMSSYNTGENIEWTPNNISSPPPYYHGVGKYGLEIAWRLDHIIDLADQNNIAIQLTLQYFQQFLSYDEWRNNPYNSANSAYGGWLTDPQQFFTDAEAIRLTKNKYRYIVARWGYSTAIESWELFNEVRYSSGASSNITAIIAWHEQMAQFIKNIDSFNHLITTSVEAGYSEANENSFWIIPSIDIIQAHSYTTDIFSYLKTVTEKLLKYGKPIFTAEFGLSADDDTPELTYNSLPEPYRSQLIEGLNFHNVTWEAFFLKSAAHLWYATYINNLRLYQLYNPLFLYINGESLGDKGLEIATANVTTQTPSIQPRTQSNYPGLIGFYDPPQQTTFTVDQYGQIINFDKMSGYLHGTIQERLRSDPTLLVNFDAPATLNLVISGVSGYAYLPSSMNITLDGTVVASLAPAAGAANLQLTADIPAGEHVVQIKNTGRDWFDIEDYAFSCPTSAVFNSHILRNIGLAGSDSAYFWVYDVDSQYGLTNNGVISNTTFSLSGFNNGTYKIQYYNTWGAGGVISEEQTRVTNGILTGTIPAFSKDIAIKVKPTAYSCTENWSCGLWSTCSNNIQTRTCTDFNNCGTTAGRPALSQSCTLICSPEWNCTNWSTCSKKIQTRTCTDSNNCGTTADRPPFSQSCTLICSPEWNCTNWSACSKGKQTRVCTDSHNCESDSSQPVESQSCGDSSNQDVSPTIGSYMKKGVYSSGRMIKTANNSAIYHITDDGRRHLYVNEATYWTWHTGTWKQQQLEIITQTAFDALPEGDHICINSGSRLIKFDNSPRIYIVFGDNNLKYITEQMAVSLFGSAYASKIAIIQSSFENDYIKNDTGFVDADNDGLTDNDEINIYKTQSANIDSDGDGYKDGREVLFNYNPDLKD